MKLKVALLFMVVCLCHESHAQNARVIYYLKDSGTLVSTKDSADYWMEVSPPDTSISKFWYVVREYGKNGKVRLQTTSKTNDLNLFYHGKYTAFYPDGRKMRSGEYVNGKFSGFQTDYYPNGNIYNIKNYNGDGAIVFVECRDSTGKILSEKGNGNWLEYSANFKDTTARGEIMGGLMNGEWTGMLNDTLGYSNRYFNGNIVSHRNIYQLKPIPGTYTGRVDKFPTFPGGIEQFYQYLGKYIRYPARAREKNEQGKVVISFVVEADGSLSNFRIAQSVSADIDGEALRVMKSSPKWVPAMKDGKPVRIQYSVPINFALAR
ncbi:MAG: TonB family protein [Bacteroidota bacterium]